MRSKGMIEKLCFFCKCNYEVKNISINQDRKFCSNKCKLDNLKILNKDRLSELNKNIIKVDLYKCSCCNIKKDDSEFYFKKDNHRFSTKCKDCYGPLINKKKAKEYPVQNDGEKICTKCKISKSRLEYRICKHIKDGRSPECRECGNKRIKESFIKYPERKLRESCRKRIRNALKAKNLYKTEKSFDLLGCTSEQFRKHIESRFTEGMNWDNYGEWHIDHIKPCASFDLSKTEERQTCFHYTNTQPLWAEDNLKKADKIGKEYGNEQ